MSDKVTQHTALLSAQEVSDICLPLKHFGITYFCHTRIDNNGTYSGMCNNPGFSDLYLRKKYFNSGIHTADTQFGDYVVWDAIETTGQSEVMLRAANEFGIRHAFTIINKTARGCDYYHFATNSPHNTINQIYMSNLDMLKLFILHYNEQIKQSPLLKLIYNLKFNIDREDERFILKSDADLNNMKRLDFVRSISLGNDQASVSQALIKAKGLDLLVHTNNNQDNDSLETRIQRSNFSKREMECLSLTVQGKSAKQISFELGISPRTVEEYIANLKMKMGVYSKAALIAKAMSLFSL